MDTHHRPSSRSGRTTKPASYSSIPFRNGPFQSLRDGILPWIFLVVSFAVYYVTLQPWAFPGSSANLAAAVAGVIPNTSPANFLWIRIARLVGGEGAGMVYRMNLVSAVFGALSVFLFYRVMLRLLTLVLEPTQIGHIPAARYDEAVRVAAFAARLGAAAAALALAFCIPYWITATRVFPHTFYICWLLLCAQLLLTFSRTRQIVWAALWALLHAAGATQAAAFIDFFPFFLMYFLYVLWMDGRIRVSRALFAAGIGILLGLSLLYVSANAFYHSPDRAIAGGYTSVFNCMSRMVTPLIRTARGSGLSQAPWLILIGLSLAPCIAALIAARRALNGENTLSFYGLHAVIAVITTLIVVDFKASPWRFFGTGPNTIVPYLLTAITFGYAATYLYLLPFNLWANAETEQRQRMGKVISAIIAVAAIALPIGAAFANLRETSNRNARIYPLYADRMIDSLEGRTWLITDGNSDNLLLLRARERGVELNCINPSTQSLRNARRKFKNVPLRNAANLGLQALIQEWLTQKDTVTKDLALARFPDFWGLGEFQMLPNRLVFLGAKPEEFRDIDAPSVAAAHEALWDELKAALDKIPVPDEKTRERKIPGDAPSLALRWFRSAIVRPQASFVGNNLGFSISMLSRDETLPEARRKALADTAYELYTKVHAFDPDNISATLNWATKVFEREPEDRQSEARDALNALNEKLDASVSAVLRVWSLSRFYGYVEDPTFFSILGWTWANTGQPNLAMQALSAAETSAPEHVRNRVKSNMARLHLAAARPEESEKIYFEMLVEDPGNREALMGLVNIFAFRGDTRRAREFLDRAKQAGEPIATRQIASAVIYSIEGDDIRARSILQDLVDTDPQNLTAWSMLCTILFEQKDSPALAEAIRSLESHAGVDAFQTLIAKALYAEMGGGESESTSETDADAAIRNRLSAARDYYVRARRTRPGNIMLLNSILTLDFKIADKVRARDHAMQILRMDLNAPFANYILGSLAIDSSDFQGAEVYLRRAVEHDPSIANLNDLADVLCRLEQYEEAGLRIQQAFKLPEAERTYELWDTRGNYLMATGDLDGAEAAFQRAISLNGEDLRVHLHLADLYQRQDKKSLAADLIRTIARQADTLTNRTDRKQFEDLHLKVLGTRYSKKDYK